MPTLIHNIDPILLDFGVVQVRWYGLFFALGLALTYFFLRHVFKREKLSLEHLDNLILYLFIGMLVGARLGHVFFYNASYYLNDPLSILKIWQGGLSSHGAALGVFFAYLIACKIHKLKFAKYADFLVLGMPIAAGFVRLGNFFNSEIIGIPTDGTWGVIFQQLGEDVPRHPSQIYEALLSFAIFGILYVAYKKFPTKKRPVLLLLFLYMGLYFASRFLVEFWKEHHTLPNEAFLSMGQWLSIIPVLIAGAYFAWLALKYNKK